MTIVRLNLISQALSDPTRVRLFAALRAGELCACQLIELVGLAPSTVSQHLACLRIAGLVSARKQGRWMYYRLLTKSEDPSAAAVVDLVAPLIESDPQLAADQEHLNQICALAPDDLCTLQRSGVPCCAPRKTINNILARHSSPARKSRSSHTTDSGACGCS